MFLCVGVGVGVRACVPGAEQEAKALVCLPRGRGVISQLLLSCPRELLGETKSA